VEGDRVEVLREGGLSIGVLALGEEGARRLVAAVLGRWCLRSKIDSERGMKNKLEVRSSPYRYTERNAK